MTDETLRPSPSPSAPHRSQHRSQQTNTAPSAHTSTAVTPSSPKPPPPPPLLSSSSSSSSRPRPPALSPTTMGAQQKSKDPERARKVRAGPYRHDAARGSIMTMPGIMGADEITYTPTTHRISKAKKGKKVHACEYPGCPKIFTRAEHRKRHEANHNTSPAFQCQIDGCKKPFQRADLLTRHMERQHNMPGETSTIRSQYSQRSMSETSTSPSRASLSAPRIIQQSPTINIPPSTGAMSIESIIEHGHSMQQQQQQQQRREFRHHSSVSSLHDLAHTPTGTAPRSLPPELLYGLSAAGDSPLYPSSDSSYSPASDYLQPTAVPHSYYSPDLRIQRSHSTGVECYQSMVHSPLAPSPLSIGPPTPSWSYDATPMTFAPEPTCMSSQRQYPYTSPSWTDATNISPYDLGIPAQSSWGQWTKVNF